MEKTKDGKKYLNAEEAIALLPENDRIHTFYSSGICLVGGGDWDRADILQKLTEVDRIEIAGGSARGMKHGLAAYNNGARLEDVLFIETDTKKLNEFDPIAETENKDGFNKKKSN